MDDLRWRERFINFSKSFLLLEKYSQLTVLSDLERGGVVHQFEMTLELSWKLMKDYLETIGIDVKSPRESIKESFRQALICEADQWLDMLDNRNIVTHTYEEAVADLLVKLVREKYCALFRELYDWFLTK